MTAYTRPDGSLRYTGGLSSRDGGGNGREMQRRLGRGNLGVGGRVLNAYLATGDDRYRAWLSSYVDDWRIRAAGNGGLVPDNVGVDGVVGSQLDGRWYGGHYG